MHSNKDAWEIKARDNEALPSIDRPVLGSHRMVGSVLESGKDHCVPAIGGYLHQMLLNRK